MYVRGNMSFRFVTFSRNQNPYDYLTMNENVHMCNLLIREFVKLLIPVHSHFIVVHIESLEHWCNSSMSDSALHFFSFTTKRLFIQPCSISKSRLILVCAALCSQLNNQPMSLILPEKMFKMPWEISWHPPWTRKEKLFLLWASCSATVQLNAHTK